MSVPSLLDPTSVRHRFHALPRRHCACCSCCKLKLVARMRHDIWLLGTLFPASRIPPLSFQQPAHPEGQLPKLSTSCSLATQSVYEVESHAPVVIRREESRSHAARARSTSTTAVVPSFRTGRCSAHTYNALTQTHRHTLARDLIPATNMHVKPGIDLYTPGTHTHTSPGFDAGDEHARQARDLSLDPRRIQTVPMPTVLLFSFPNGSREPVKIDIEFIQVV